MSSKFFCKLVVAACMSCWLGMKCCCCYWAAAEARLRLLVVMLAREGRALIVWIVALPVRWFAAVVLEMAALRSSVASAAGPVP